MSKRSVGVFVVMLLAAVVAVPIAFSQMGQGQPVVYTFVSQFDVPRAHWAEYSENTQKSFVPIADKLVADGTILSYATFEHIVHTADGYTHGAAFTSTSIAGLTKVLDEVRKAGPQPGQIAATKHADFLMQTSMYIVGSGKPAYLRVVCQNATPDKPENYAVVLKKYLWAAAEENVKNGTLSYIGYDQQYVNTTTPSTRCVVIDFPNADAMDKWAGVVSATLGKMSPAERSEFFGATVVDSRRDIMARITHSGHK